METTRLKLREWKEEDLNPFFKLNSNSDVMEFFPSKLSKEESDASVDGIIKHFETYGFGLYAVEKKDSQEFIGFVGMQHVPFTAKFTPAIEIGWRLHPDFWGNGYATEAAQKVLEFAWNDLGIQEVVALVVPENKKSRRVMEKLGMTHSPAEDFLHPHPKLKNTKLEKHTLYRISSPLLQK